MPDLEGASCSLEISEIKVQENGQNQILCSDAFRAAIDEVMAVHAHDLQAAYYTIKDDLDYIHLSVPGERESVALQGKIGTFDSANTDDKPSIDECDGTGTRAAAKVDVDGTASQGSFPLGIINSKGSRKKPIRSTFFLDPTPDSATPFQPLASLTSDLKESRARRRFSRGSASSGDISGATLHSAFSRFSELTNETRLTHLPQTKEQEIEALYGRDFEVRQIWDNADLIQKANRYMLAQKSGSLTKALAMHGQSEPDFTAMDTLEGVTSYFMGSPAQPRRIGWELAGMVLVLYDLILVPMVMAFEPPRNVFVDSMDWIQLFYWTMNVPVVLTTGYIEKGYLFLSPWKVFAKYVQTWLFIDIVTIVPDWIFTVSNMFSESADDDSSSTGAFVRLLRIVRLMRLARLLRLVKLRNAWNLIYDMIDSEKVGIVLEIWKMVLVLMLVNHYVACLWFAIGSSGSKTWVSEAGFSHVSWIYQYVVSFHWSVTQFTPASMSVQPQSIKERVFALVIVIFALVGFSYLVGSITGSLTRLRAMGEHKSNNFWLLRRFLKRNHIPADLSIRIKNYAESVWDHQHSHMKVSSVQVLSLLSVHLRAELSCAMHGPALRIHPLFDRLHVDSPVTLRRLAFQGIEQLSLAPLDNLFAAGEEATHMSILTDGRLQYHRTYFDSISQMTVDSESSEELIAEPTLWVHAWVHLGDIRAETSTELLRISPDSWFSIASLNPVAFRLTSGYAGRYVEWLNDIAKEYLSDILHGDETKELRQFVDAPNRYAVRQTVDSGKPCRKTDCSSIPKVLKSWIDEPHECGRNVSDGAVV